MLSFVLVLTLANTAAIGVIATKEFREMGLKKVLKPSTELADFLDDIKAHGYGVVRISPDTLLVRSPNR